MKTNKTTIPLVKHPLIPKDKLFLISTPQGSQTLFHNLFREQVQKHHQEMEHLVMFGSPRTLQKASELSNQGIIGYVNAHGSQFSGANIEYDIIDEIINEEEEYAVVLEKWKFDNGVTVMAYQWFQEMGQDAPHVTFDGSFFFVGALQIGHTDWVFVGEDGTVGIIKQDKWIEHNPERVEDE